VNPVSSITSWIAQLDVNESVYVDPPSPPRGCNEGVRVRVRVNP